MVMRTMRENTKWIMLFLTVAFVGWLVFDWVQSGTGQGTAANPTVAVVNGEEIRYARWSRFLQNRLERARQQVQGSLTDEQRHQAEERAWDQLVNQTLIQQELERLELEATEAEIKQAFRTSPPPSLRNRPEFQTDGQFDYQKYRQFFASGNADPRLLMQIEQYYRETIPRMKLQRLVAEEVTLTDAELWEVFRDRNATAQVRFAALDPADVVEADVEVTDQEVRDYYRDHRDEFARPATAVVDVASLGAQPSASDSARARSRVDSLERVVRGGETTFPELVDQISRDTPGDLRASELGPVGRQELVEPLRETVFSATVGELVGPVSTPSGYHLVQVSEREGGEASFSHVVVPVRLSMEGEDRLFSRMDTLEGVALREGLEAAADSLGMEVRNDVELEKGTSFVPGAGALGVAVSWAFSGETRAGDLSQFFENPSGYHILELEGRQSAGTRPLEEVTEEIRQRLQERAIEDRARDRLAAMVDRVQRGEVSLDSLAARNGWDLQKTASAFDRNSFVLGLGRRTEAVGAAFGLEPDQVAGPFEAAEGQLAILQLVEKSSPDREEFESVKDQLRRRLQRQRQQQHVQRWIQALREEATIRDLRDQAGSRGQGSRPPARTS